MKKGKIIIIRGKVTAGKTTTSHALAKVLPGWILIDVWKIKEMFEPLELKDRKPLIKASKKSMIEIMRIVMRELGINIIVQETTQRFLKKHLRNDLKKHNYEIHSFFLDIDLKRAAKRDIQREKPTMHLGKKIKTEEEWKKQKGAPDRGDVIINTADKTPKEIVKLILKEVNEKPRKHPKADWIRRSW